MISSSGPVQQTNSGRPSGRGVSAVIAITLMLAITVILSSVVLVVIFDSSDGAAASIDTDVSVTALESNDYIVRVDSMGGAESIELRCGNKVATATETGDEAHVRGDCARLTVVAKSNNHEQTVFSESTSSMDKQNGSRSMDAGPDLGTCLGDMSQTASSEYIIRNAHDLQCMRTDLTADYVLGNNINARGTALWNGGEGFSPIGGYSTAASDSFSGSFDGRGHTITGLTINRPSSYRQSFIGRIQGADYVKNVVLKDPSIRGHRYVGGAIGYVSGSGTEISNISVDGGTVDGTMSSASTQVGGVIGGLTSGNSASGLYSSSNVMGSHNRVGGVVGYASASVTDVHMAGEVHGRNRVGGAIGDSRRNVTDVRVNGVVHGNGRVGGAIGHAQGANSEIQNISVSADVTGTGNNVGGIIGIMFSDTAGLRNVTMTGDVRGEGDDIGGIVGEAHESVIGASMTGTVSAESSTNVGGVVGQSRDIVKRSYSLGDVTGGNYVGGLVGDGGYTNSKIIDSFSRGDVDSSGWSGGVAAQVAENTEITRTYVSGRVRGDTGGMIIGFGPPTYSATETYYNTKYGDTGSVGVGISDDEMTGGAAKDNMSGFDFTSEPVWRVYSDYPYLVG